MGISRWWSFFTDFIAVTFGSLLALPAFHVLLYVAMLAGTIAVNAFANFMNDIYDFKNGEGTRAGITLKQPNPLVNKSASMGALWRASAISLIIGAISGLYIASQRGLIVIALGLVGISAAYAYSAGKRNFKSLALGEVLVFLVFGPLMAGASYFMESGAINPSIMLASVIPGILIALILFANNIRDIEVDKAAGARTIAGIIGHKRSLSAFHVLTLAIYALLILLIAVEILPLLALLALLSAPLAFKLNKRFSEIVPKNSAEQVSNFALLFTALLSAGLVLQYLFLA